MNSKENQSDKLQAIEKIGQTYLVAGSLQTHCTEELFIRDNSIPDYSCTFQIKTGEVIDRKDVYLDRFCENEEWVYGYRLKATGEQVEEKPDDDFSSMEKLVRFDAFNLAKATCRSCAYAMPFKTSILCGIHHTTFSYGSLCEDYKTKAEREAELEIRKQEIMADPSRLKNK